MAWALTLDGLAAQRDEAIARAEKHASHMAFEGLARAHRWLGEEAEARRWFRAAAEDLDARVERPGRGDASSRGQTGVLLRHAGDDEGARHWLEWAVATVSTEYEGGRADLAAWKYLLGDADGCLAAIATLPWRSDDEFTTKVLKALARARSRAKPKPIDGAVARLAGYIRADRRTPASGSGHAAGGSYDWLEEALRLEAELRGSPVPDHATMLERAGLLAPGGRAATPPAAIDLPAAGRWSIPRRTSRGRTVDLVLTREPGETDALLDPRAGTELKVIFGEHLGEVRIQIEWGDDEDGWDEHRLGPFADLAEGADAAADWLRAYGPDPPGGAWAAEALGALLATAQRG